MVEVDLDTYSSAVFGSLPAGDGEDSTLSPAFREALARFHRYRESYASGRISASEFGELLKDLLVLDTELGVWWTLGATTGGWYARSRRDAPWSPAGMPSGVEGLLVDRDGNPVGFQSEQPSPALSARTSQDEGGPPAQGKPAGDVVSRAEPGDRLLSSWVDDVAEDPLPGSTLQEDGDGAAAPGVLAPDVGDEAMGQPDGRGVSEGAFRSA